MVIGDMDSAQHVRYKPAVGVQWWTGLRALEIASPAQARHKICRQPAGYFGLGRVLSSEPSSELTPKRKETVADISYKVRHKSLAKTDELPPANEIAQVGRCFLKHNFIAPLPCQDKAGVASCLTVTFHNAIPEGFVYRFR
jgi:hypothetical protein